LLSSTINVAAATRALSRSTCEARTVGASTAAPLGLPDDHAAPSPPRCNLPADVMRRCGHAGQGQPPLDAIAAAMGLITEPKFVPGHSTTFAARAFKVAGVFAILRYSRTGIPTARLGKRDRVLVHVPAARFAPGHDFDRGCRRQSTRWDSNVTSRGDHGQEHRLYLGIELELEVDFDCKPSVARRYVGDRRSTPNASGNFDRSRPSDSIRVVLNPGFAGVRRGRQKAARSVPHGSIAHEIRRSLRGQQE
jgi:hypothetical protein